MLSFNRPVFRSRRNLAVMLSAISIAGCGQTPVANTGAPAPGETRAEAAAQVPAMAQQPPAVKSLQLTVPANSALRVRMDASLSTKTTRSGEAFSGTLAEPFVFEGHQIALSGARVGGLVTSSNSGGRVKGRAAITVRLTSLTLADGKSVDLRTTTVSRVARATKKKDALKIGVGSGIGAAIGAIAGGGKGAAIGAGAGAGGGTGVVLATKGDPAVISAESVLRFQLREPLNVELPQ